MVIVAKVHTDTCWDMVSHFFNVKKPVVFEQASSGITTFNMIVELNITTRVSKLWSEKNYSQFSLLQQGSEGD